MRRLLTHACICLAATAAASGQTAQIDLTSSVHGAAVHAGDTVDWTITAAASNGDNLGLALVCVDLVQNANNPELFDLSPGSGPPAALADFDRPAGISNPGPGGVGSAWGGTPIGTPGSMNLAQIGGAQSTFGIPGVNVGQDVNIDGGIGQSPGGQIVSTGSFPAPASPGAYVFSLQSPIANTLDEINAPPAWSAVSMAPVVSNSPSINVTVCLPGDASGDLVVDPAQDIPAFVDELVGTSSGSYAQCASDLNLDGSVDGADIAPFVALLLGP